MKVEEIMTSSPVVAHVDDTIGEVIRLMRDVDARHIPVVDGMALVGIVSDRDLLQVDSKDASLQDEQIMVLDDPVAEIMSTDVISIESEADVEELVEIMVDQRIGAVPVVEPGTERLVGIVSYIDVLKAASFS